MFRPAAALLIAVMLTAVACRQQDALVGARTADLTGPPPAQFPCEVEYTVIQLEVDSLLTQYGAPTVEDTINVCRTWTGSDFDLQVRLLGSSEMLLPGGIDSVRGGEWRAGVARTLDANGNDLAPAEAIGGTLLTEFDADEPTRAAVADDPYHDLISPGECVSDAGQFTECAPSDCSSGEVECSPTTTDLMPASTATAERFAAVAAPADGETRYKRHKLRRSGVRARLETFVEEESSDPRRRRFSKEHNGRRHSVVLDRRTQLVVEESSDSGDTRQVLRYRWKKITGGFVRTGAMEHSDEVVAGKRYRAASARHVIALRWRGARALSP